MQTLLLSEKKWLVEYIQSAKEIEVHDLFFLRDIRSTMGDIIKTAKKKADELLKEVPENTHEFFDESISLDNALRSIDRLEYHIVDRELKVTSFKSSFSNIATKTNSYNVIKHLIIKNKSNRAIFNKKQENNIEKYLIL